MGSFVLFDGLGFGVFLGLGGVDCWVILFGCLFSVVGFCLVRRVPGSFSCGWCKMMCV